jgi:signal transduction histidine kinase
VPTERLGLRVSILERVASAGGVVEIESAEGQGTLISIQWPDPVSSVSETAAAGTSATETGDPDAGDVEPAEVVS